MEPTNNAAFLLSKDTPLKVQPSVLTPPGPHEILIKNHALAINPYDHIIQSAPSLVVPWNKLPFILGADVSGIVHSVGSSVSRFKPGDRVLGHANGLSKFGNAVSEGGFQEYTILRENVTSHIPNSMSYETASVLPLALSTAACALFQHTTLALPYPTLKPVSTGKTLLIWGGSTSVGCNAIQLAIAAGYSVITTASPKNHSFLKKLGVEEVFDYNSPTVIPDLISAFQKRDLAGAISIGTGSFSQCIKVVSALKLVNKFVAQISMDLPPFPKGPLDFPGFLLGFLGNVIKGWAGAKWNGVRYKMVIGSDLVENEVGKAIYEDFLEGALEKGVFVPAPEAEVVGKGLADLQRGMDKCKKGVSLKKLAVVL